MNGEMFRRYRQNKNDYLKNIEAVFCGDSVQLRKPDGGIMTIRSRGDVTDRAFPGKPRAMRAQMMLCRVDTGEPTRPATPQEIELAQRGRPNRRSEDPIVGKITASDGKAYYVRVVTAADLEKFAARKAKPQPASPEPMQEEVAEEGDINPPPLDLDGAEGTVGPAPEETKDERRARLKRELEAIETEGESL